MKIECLDPLGINGYERKANDILAECLPDSWKAYSSLEMIGRQSREFEADLVLITDDRIIVVELKNYKGRLFSIEGKWIQQYEDGHEESRKNGVIQARRAAQILSSKLDEKLKGKFRPWVDYCVVLCGSANQSDLPIDEQNYVFTLEQFKKIGDEKEYKKCFGSKKKINRKEDAPNKNITVWDRMFSNNSADFKTKAFSVNNYVQKDTNSFFSHKEGLYSEFRSERADNHNYKAIMRRWDFTSPCIIEYARTPDQRALIAHRESSVLGYINSQDDDLKNVHLQLLHLPKDLTSDFVELYEWPNKKERLDSFIRKNQTHLTKQNRLDLIQSLINQLARLHDIDVAHRDVGPHSIWLSLPSKVVLSNFLTATYPDPENKTVSSICKILQHGRVDTPEELFEDSSGTAFTRDVYLTMAASHYIAFGRWPQKEDGIYVWEEISDNDISDLLSTWFGKGLDLDSSTRFQDLRQALTELNKLLSSNDEYGRDKLYVLSKYYKSVNVFTDFLTSQVQSIGNCHLLRSVDNQFGIKTWFGVTELSQTGGINHQLLSFFSRLETLQNTSLDCIPKIIDFGINPMMANVYFQYEWIEGETWDLFIDKSNQATALETAKSLLNTLISLHLSNIYHGDIQPGNVVIKDNKVIFIDLVDFEGEAQGKHTPSYVPSNFESLSKASIDRFAVIKLLNELAIKHKLLHLDIYTKKLLDLPEIVASEMDRLNDNFEQIIMPPIVIKTEVYNISYKSFSSYEGEFLADDGVYYISIYTNSGRNKDLVKVFITGVQSQVELLLHPERKFIVTATISNIRHDQFIRSKRNAELELNGCIKLSSSCHESNEKIQNYIFDSNVYIQLLETETAVNDSSEKIKGTLSLSKLKKPNIINAKEIWHALVETEHESNPKIQIVTDPKYTEQGTIVFRYVMEKNGFDFDLSSEKVALKTLVKDELRLIGWLHDYNSDTVIFKPKNRSNLQIGDTITLEGNLTAASLAKRKKAISNLIRGRSIIPNITDYFSLGIDVLPISGVEPRDDELDAYTEINENGKVIFALNEKQRLAFKKLYKYGPIALLQGPPGTGKTAFIGSFIHYSISQGARRVLLVSQSHEAVNNATEKVRSLFNRNGSSIDIVRLGDQNNLSMALNDVGEKALQDYYRDKFKAEYKERINGLVEELGADPDFVNVITEFETSFGKKIDQLISLAKDPDLWSGNTIATRVKTTLEQLSNYLERELELVIHLENIELSELRKFLYSKIGAHYEIYSEELIYKLRNIVAVSNEWLSVMASSQSQFQNFLAKTRTLVCGTCVGIGRYHYGIQENVYDLVVIDEAARSSASELAIAMQVGRKILLVGDHKQLPPLFDEQHIKAAKRILSTVDSDEFKRSDFERAFVSNYGEKVGCSLLMQYRMVPAIGDLVSHCFYNNKLDTGRGSTKPEYKQLIDDFAAPVTWFDTGDLKGVNYEQRPTGKGVNIKSWINDFEAEKVILLIKRIYDSDSQDLLIAEGDEPKIGVICMYGEQVRVLIKKINSLSWARNLLEKRIIKIDTVDSYQGKENDIIILSLVRSNKEAIQGHVSSESRANVSLSRAKEALFIVGNKNMWLGENQNSAFGRVLNYILSGDLTNYRIVNTEELE